MNNVSQSDTESNILRKPVNKKVNKFKDQLNFSKEKHKKNIANGVSIITVTNRINHFTQVFNNYNRQNINKKELIVVLNNNSMNLKQWQVFAKKNKDVRIFRKDETVTFAECKNFAITKANLPYITHFDDDDYYAANFLKDILVVFNKEEADIIGKRSAFVYFEGSKTLAVRLPGNENCYVQFVMDSSMVIKKEIFNIIQFPILKSGADFSFQKECIKKGIKIYSVDRYNYAFIRHKSTDTHSWKIDDSELIKECKIIMKTDNFIEHIIK